MERLFNVDAAAEKLGGVSTWTLRGWLSQGKLRKTKVGRRTMIAESELERFVRESQRQESRIIAKGTGPAKEGGSRR